MNNRKYKIGITHGDINGISYEIILKAFSNTTLTELFTPIIYGSSKVAAFYAKTLAMEVPVWNLIESPTDAKGSEVNIVDCCDPEVTVALGEVAPQSAGKAAFDALQRATQDWREGKIDALVTCPINKSAMPAELFPFNGHTDYLAHRLNGEQEPLMILCATDLRVALATTHVAISEVAARITQDLLLHKVRCFEKSLIQDFGVVKPRIALLALNPHAGDNGLMGREEQDIIVPAIKKLFNEEGIYAFGPFSADGFFGAQEYRNYDGVLAMYHDQGLAPFKTLFMADGVNVTAGLSKVRTSPDHGTGYDIVGKGEASYVSLTSAIYTAIDVLRNRNSYAVARKNPLRSIYRDSGNDNEKLATLPEESEHLL